MNKYKQICTLRMGQGICANVKVQSTQVSYPVVHNIVNLGDGMGAVKNKKQNWRGGPEIVNCHIFQKKRDEDTKKGEQTKTSEKRT